MRIAILAYGSLVWDEECLAPHITGGWRLGEGPALPVEFCRVSPKRKKALVLTIDAEQGHEVATSYTISRRTDIAEAVADLAARERCDERHIGICIRQDNPENRPAPPHGLHHHNLGGREGERAGAERASAQNESGPSHHSAQEGCTIHQTIHTWLQRQADIDAAIWAALPANFRAETGRKFSHDTAVDYLRSLPEESLAEAWRYITFAPRETDTPLRRHLDGHEWWRGLDFTPVTST